MRKQKAVVSSLAQYGLIGWLRRFVSCESAVVTVEWVALAAGLTIGAIAISYIVMNGLVAPAHSIANQLSP